MHWSTEKAGPELGGRTKYNEGPNCKGGKWRTNSKYWKMEDLKMEDHLTGLENAGPRKDNQKESGWKLKDHSRSYNKAKHSCTRRSKSTARSITLTKQRESIKSHDEHFTQTR